MDVDLGHFVKLAINHEVVQLLSEGRGSTCVNAEKQYDDCIYDRYMITGYGLCTYEQVLQFGEHHHLGVGLHGAVGAREYGANAYIKVSSVISLGVRGDIPSKGVHALEFARTAKPAEPAPSSSISRIAATRRTSAPTAVSSPTCTLGPRLPE